MQSVWILGFALAAAAASYGANASAENAFLEVKVGAYAGTGGASPEGRPVVERVDVEAGVGVGMDAMYYNTESEEFTFLWELRAAARGFGGYHFGPAGRIGGGGGFEMAGSGDIGMTISGIIPFNQALEDWRFRITEEGPEGKVLIGTSHVLPLDAWFDVDDSDRGFYFSVSHGMRYHSENRWVWAVQPKFRFFDWERVRVEARYLFGIWKQGRMEHSGALVIDVPVGESVVMNLFAQPEYVRSGSGEPGLLTWRGLLEVSAVL